MNPRALMWLAIWGSIQLFFISSFSWLLWRVEQVYRIVRRHEASCRRSVSEIKHLEASITEKDA